MQSNGKKTTTTTGGAIVLVFSLPYHDRIKNPKKQTNFIIYIRYRKKNRKKVKKNLQVHFFVVSLQQKQKTKVMEQIFISLINAGTVTLSVSDAAKFNDWLLLRGYRPRVFFCEEQDGKIEVIY